MEQTSDILIFHDEKRQQVSVLTLHVPQFFCFLVLCLRGHIFQARGGSISQQIRRMVDANCVVKWREQAGTQNTRDLTRDQLSRNKVTQYYGVWLGGYANISFSFQAVKTLSAHPTYLRFRQFCTFFVDFWIHLGMIVFFSVKLKNCFFLHVHKTVVHHPGVPFRGRSTVLFQNFFSF